MKKLKIYQFIFNIIKLSPIKISITQIMLIFFPVIFLLTGCGALSFGMAEESTFSSVFDNPDKVQVQVGSYDSADTAIIKNINAEEENITLVNLKTGKSYTLYYDGTTVIRDRYDVIMSMAQLNQGDIVDITFMKGSKRLVEASLSSQAFSYDSISKYSFNEVKKSAYIGDDTYQLKNSVLVFSEGKLVGTEDIVSKDVITVKGIGRNIYSVSVDKGHGYLRLENDAYVIGGWIEVGQSVIQEITDHMLLTVPEGTYDVRITGKGVDTVQTVVIERNKETVIDLGFIEIEEVKAGKIFFTVDPEDAVIYIDGEETDVSKPVELEYGLHQIMAKADGYATLTQYIKVSQEIASINITMEESSEVAEEEEKPSTVSGNELTTGSYRVYIDSPSGVEVYLDGVYKGIIPVSFRKVAGTYTLSLRKEGYITKSYTIYIDDDASDVTYSFSKLDSDGGTVSGNDSSGNNTTNNNSNNNNSTGNNNTVSDNDTVSDNE